MHNLVIKLQHNQTTQEEPMKTQQPMHMDPLRAGRHQTPTNCDLACC